MAAHGSVYGFVALEPEGEAEFSLQPFSSCACPPPGRGTIPKHLPERRGHSSGIFGRDDERFPGRHDIRDSSDAGGDDWHLSCHRFEQRDGGPLRARGHREHVERSKEASGTRYEAVPTNPVLHPQGHCAVFQ